MNQLAAEIKLLEVWKSLHVEGCPTTLEPYNQHQGQNDHQLRPKPTRVFKDSARLAMSQSSFYIDAARVWNNAPSTIKSAATVHAAKKVIKEHCKPLPI